MEVGKLYSCKWKVWAIKGERGWDMLMFLGMKGSRYYLFYDVLRGQKCVLDDGIIRHCKEINLEEQCTQ